MSESHTITRIPKRLAFQYISNAGPERVTLYANKQPVESLAPGAYITLSSKRPYLLKTKRGCATISIA
jgi:hypothetical protein